MGMTLLTLGRTEHAPGEHATIHILLPHGTGPKAYDDWLVLCTGRPGLHRLDGGFDVVACKKCRALWRKAAA